MNTPNTFLQRELLILENKNMPGGSQEIKIYPPTILEQVFDIMDPGRKNLKQILEDIREEIRMGGDQVINFPVRTVNGQIGDINITKESLGLSNVDNTSDNEKPLSDLQRQMVEEMIRGISIGNPGVSGNIQIIDDEDIKEMVTTIFDDVYKSKTDEYLDSIHAGITELQQGNSLKMEDINPVIRQMIEEHDHDRTAHKSILNELVSLNNKYTGIEESVTNKINAAIADTLRHYEDEAAHYEIFKTKESNENKVDSINNKNTDYVYYPSTKALVDYVTLSLEDYNKKYGVDEWISSINVIDSKSKLPEANKSSYRSLYFISDGSAGTVEIAICKKNPDDTYGWDIMNMGIYNKFDPRYFNETSVGISPNITKIGQEVLNQSDVREDIERLVLEYLPSSMDKFYTKEEIDDKHYIQSITIIPGTTDASIRYYINDDKATVSKDINIHGLKSLAFKDKVNESNIEDESIFANHLNNRIIEARHLGDKSVTAQNMYAKYMTLFGNVSDTEHETVTEIPFDHLVELLTPMMKSIFESTDLVQMTEGHVLELIRTEFHKRDNWLVPELSFNVTVRNDQMFIEYDESAGVPNLVIDENGDLILLSDGDRVDEDLQKVSFRINSDYDLIMSVNI